MKSSSLQAHEHGGLVRAAEAWNRFWFAPGNPATLGLIRILAGVLALYTHVAYTPDLYSFFGREGWTTQATANQQRKEAPWIRPSMDWYPTTPTFPLPPDAASRDAILNYIGTLGDRAAERQKLLKVFRQQESPDNVTWENPPPPPALLSLLDPRVTSDPSAPGRVATFVEDLYKLDRAEREHILSYMKEWGLDSRQISQQGQYAFSIWYHVGDPFWMGVTHACVLLIFVMFAAGFCTRITSVLAWLSAVSYLQRSPMTLFGGDTMMNILLLYLMIGPSGAALSVDRLIGRWWAVRKARLAGLPIPPETPPRPLISANFALRLMQVHFCMIYFAAGTSKLLGGNWWNGQAIYYTMANYEFAPLRHAYYSGMLRFLCGHRWLWEVMMEGGSYFTLALEIGLPFLVWNRRLRPYVVFGSAMLHTMIALTMGLVVFSLLMATLVISFVPGEAVQRALASLNRLVARLLGRPLPPPVTEELPPVAEELPEPPAEEKVIAGTRIKAKDKARR